MEAAIKRDNTAPARRRENAPIRRPRRPATIVPDVLLATAAAALAMAAIFLAETFVSNGHVEGDASETLARVFAATLAMTGVMIFFMALVLLRDERRQGDHYRGPLAIGAVVGVIEAILFLRQGDQLLVVPPVFLLLAARPLRRFVGRLLPTRDGGE